MGLQQCIDDAVEELNRILEDIELCDVDGVEDTFFELADSHTPVYYANALECAESDFDLFLTRPDLAGEDTTPIKMIQLNIFERIEQALWARLEEWKEEQEEIEADREWLEREEEETD